MKLKLKPDLGFVCGMQMYLTGLAFPSPAFRCKIADFEDTQFSYPTGSHDLLPVTCYLLPVTCYLFPVTCYLLPVTCFLLPVTCYLSSHLSLVTPD